MKTGIIDVGGGMRDIYGAGVLDKCMEYGINFDHCIGVSAGSANLSAYISGQKGRNYSFYIEYAFRKEYMSTGNWMRKRNFVDLDYVFGTLSNSDGENPFDYSKAIENPARFQIVATNALTGKAHYFEFSDMKQDDYGAIKASNCVPVVNKPYIVDGVPYFDGGLSDPIPLEKCLEEGCEKTVIILTRPKDFRRSADSDNMIVKLLRKKYPEAAKAMHTRADHYNSVLDMAVEMEKDGKVLIVAPDSIEGMKTLKRDKDAMISLYKKGLTDAEKIRDYLKIKSD